MLAIDPSSDRRTTMTGTTRNLPFAMFLAVSALLAPGAWATDLRAELAPADRALAAQQYPAAYRAYVRHAPRNALAEFNLGLFEQHGWGRPANPAAACAWFEKAARRHIPAAQQFLGDCLAQGIGRAADGLAALQWYAKAAAAGIAAADCAAGELYLAGKVVPRDLAQGLALCTRTAQAESVPAMLKLADHYRSGNDNLPLARFWYDQAAQRHSHVAQWRLGLMQSAGEGGAADVAQARFWLEHAAMEGYAPAYLPTAILYANAPVDPATGALAPADLARVYMWNQAALAATPDPVQLAAIARIDAIVQAVMPPPWRADLDRKVAAHLARFSPQAAH
jgi:TPR repeat protein